MTAISTPAMISDVAEASYCESGPFYLAGAGLVYSQPAVLVDPIRTIVSAFDRVNLVGLGERHQSFEDPQFRLKLIRDPMFQRKVNDIVIKFGNQLYQPILD